MVSVLVLVLIFLFILVVTLFLVFVFRRIFVFPESFGKYSPPILSPCQGTTCGGVGSQVLYQQCVPNPATGLGCLDGLFNQTFEDIIIETRECTSECPSTVETVINESRCVNGSQTITYYCQETGFLGTGLCTVGEIRQQIIDCYPNDI
jgi:hypothetical protein